jgi:hypothetical protein
VELPQEAEKAQREALMTGLSSDAAEAADASEVPTAELQALPGYAPVDADSDEEGAGGSADAAAAELPDAPPQRAADAAPVHVAGSAAASPLPLVRNPVYYARKHGGKKSGQVCTCVPGGAHST